MKGTEGIKGDQRAGWGARTEESFKWGSGGGPCGGGSGEGDKFMVKSRVQVEKFRF